MTRFLLKQFAGNANNNGVFGSYEAGTKIKSNDPDTIQSLTAYSNGWLDATTQATQLPSLEEMQGLQYLFCKSIKELYSEGIPQWLSIEEYQLNSFCVYNGVIYKNITGNYTTSNPSIDNTNWEELKTGGSRNIGELVASTIPLTDAGLHLLDGTLIDGTGIYNNFYNYILNLYNSGDYSDIFETEANWQTSVTTYGVCGKYVIDTVNQTVRLPKITGFIEGANNVANIGDLTEAGLPNITGYIDGCSRNGDMGGAFYSGGGGRASGNGSEYDNYKAMFDASQSSPTYGNSNTVQPQSIKVLFYIVIATSVKTDIEIDIDEIVNDLNNKADINGSNVNENFFTGANFTADTIDYIVESGSNANGFYKKFKSGKTIQANEIVMGVINGNSDKTYNVTLPTPATSTNYFVSVNLTTAENDYASIGWAVLNKSTTGFRIEAYNTQPSTSGNTNLGYIVIEF